MKKVLLSLLVLMSTVVFAQDKSLVDCEPTTELKESKVTPYIAAGLSMTNSTDFNAATYPSMEIGIMRENVSIAGVFGRNNLAEVTPEHIDNYWYEGKVAYSFPLGFVSGYGVFGVGTYIGTSGSLFIEYGGGIVKEFGSFGTFIQVSSWDGVTYLTPGFSISF